MRIEYGFFLCRQPLFQVPRILKEGKKIFKLSHSTKDVKWIWGSSVEQLAKGHTSKTWIIEPFSFKDLFDIVSFARVYLTKAERKENRAYYYTTRKEIE